MVHAGKRCGTEQFSESGYGFHNDKMDENNPTPRLPSINKGNKRRPASPPETKLHRRFKPLVSLENEAAEVSNQTTKMDEDQPNDNPAQN